MIDFLKRKFKTDHAIIMMIVLLVIVILMCTLGCKSTKPDPCLKCPPKIEIQEIDKEVPCIYMIGLLDSLVLPERPPFPGHDATDEEIDRWLADLDANIKARETLLVNRVSALEGQISTHNEQEPKCINID